jgi:hypothetical protein
MKTAATTAIRRPVVAPTATPAVCDVVSGGGLPASGVLLGVPDGVVLEAGVGGFSLLVVDAPPMPDAEIELGSSVRALNALSSVVEAMTPAEVEFVTLCIEVVCKLSASVTFRLGEILVPIPVGITDRLNVIPSSTELVLVLLRPSGRPVVAAMEDCIGVDRVEFAPGPCSEDDTSDSLAGTRMPDVDEDTWNDVVSGVWIAV